jgi:hypothetical protein
MPALTRGLQSARGSEVVIKRLQGTSTTHRLWFPILPFDPPSRLGRFRVRKGLEPVRDVNGDRWCPQTMRNDQREPARLLPISIPRRSRERCLVRFLKCARPR